jgi:hypothetical protein
MILDFRAPQLEAYWKKEAEKAKVPMARVGGN